MHLLFNHEIFFNQKYGGISRMQAELIKGLPDYKDITVEQCVWYNLNYHYYRKRIKIFDDLVFKFDKIAKGRLLDPLKILNQLDLNRRLRKGNFDFYIPTYYSTAFLKHIGNKPFILTVYDMIHEIYPQFFPRDTTTIPHKKELLLKAKRIVAISHSTKNDILKFYPQIDPDTIDIVYLSHSMDRTKDDVVSGLPEKYILFVGNRKNYKNFKLLVDAAKDILNKDTTLNLVCTGDAFTTEEQQMFADYHISNQLHYVRPTDKELYCLYNKSQVFVFPSSYEGFGVPVVEAMYSGTPVILTNRSSFPEVAGDAGIFFEDGDQQTLTSQLEKVLYNTDFRNETIKAGYKQADKFSWENTVKDFYHTVKSTPL